MEENKFSKSKIYKIVNDVDDCIYIGSTILPLGVRFSKHKNKFKKNTETQTKAKLLFENYGLKNCHIELIENYPCISRKELCYREKGFIIANQNNCINKQIPTRTKKEYRQDVREARLKNNNFILVESI
jgi:hypothetical protein